MPSSRKSVWWCPFATDVRAGAAVIAAGVVAAAGCSGDDSCGPTGDDPGITLTVAGQTASFTDFTASANNDCPSPGHPTAITVSGSQVGAAGSIILCLSTPDDVGGTELLTFEGDVRLMSLSAQLDCPTVVDRGQDPGLTASFTGYCDSGTYSDGFSLAMAGDQAMIQQCEDGDTPATATITGSATVLVP